uniref:YD repeat protein n=1 Tax=Shewanella putrefaciens (strain CN-32 / ATCC BAA-453) TaxID=319224 RepID=A4Y7F5_SHEPC
MSESRTYYSEGTMASVEVDGPLGRIHAHYYDGYDEFMNLTSERNGVTGLNKSYRYDALNRLTAYQFSNTNPTFNATVNYAYDKVGNFLNKTDYSANSTSAYRYGGSACGYKPNAVCQLTKLNGTTVSFQYDNRGNLRVGDGLTMTYNAMDKPLSVSGRGATTSFVYGSDNMRAKQSRTVGSTTTTTYYVDKYYEADSDGSWRAYLDDIAVLSYTPTRSHLLQFTLKDRLGSATTLADQHGNIVSQRYFDPFGRTTDLGINHQLDIQNKNTVLSQLQDLAVTNKNRRGFTDHEHLNEQQLIHMNGRIYDYNLGRFMSVDPFIQSPTSTQSVNPYSYIMNNPLAGTDPTGYLAECPDRNEGCPKPEEEKPEKKRRMDGSGRGSGWTVIYDRSSNGSSKGQAAVASSIANAGKTADIGSQKNIAQNSSAGNSGTSRGDSSLQEQIKSDAHNSIVRAGEELGVDMGQGSHADYGGVDAKWGSVTRGENGNITNATISCDRACQMGAANQGRITSHDIAMAAMRSSYLHSQRQVAQGTYKAVEYGSYAFLGGEIVAASIARWSFLKATEKLAYFGLIGEAASLATGVDGSAAAVMQGAKTLIPRMRVVPSVGKPKIRVDKNGQYIVE